MNSPKRIKRWKKNGWKNAAKKPVKNQDLWQALDAVAARRVDPFPVYIAYGLTRERAFVRWRREAIAFGAVALAMSAVLLALALLNLRRTREMAQADRRKDEFLAALAHELRNPLGAIANGSALLEKSPDVEKSARIAVPIIGRQVRQLQRLVDDLLDTARSVHGKLMLERKPLELRELAAAAVAAQRERAGESREERRVPGHRLHAPREVDATPNG